MRKLRKGFVVSSLVAVIAVCFGYPAISTYINTLSETKAIQGYTTNSISPEKQEQLLEKADDYNETLFKIKNPLNNKESADGYDETLNVQGSMMGYLEVPSIDLKLPIYHYTTSDSLEKGVGHMVGTSLPCGGESTHAVLSSHNGMSNHTGFTNLELLNEGDIFKITVLNRTLTYEVDQIKTVLPDEYSNLEIVEGEDLVTLLTCTPYGINTHRLLVRGHRIENVKEPATKVKEIKFNTKQKLIAGTIAMSAAVLATRILLRKKRKEAYAKKF